MIPTRRVSLEKRTEIFAKDEGGIQGAKNNAISSIQARQKEVTNEGGNSAEQINGAKIVEEGGLPGKALDAQEDLEGPGETSSSTDVVQKDPESDQKGANDGNAGEDQRTELGNSMEKAAEELEQPLQNSTESRPSAEGAQTGNEEHGQSHGREAIEVIGPESTEASIDKTTVEPEQPQEAREILSTTEVASDVQNENGQGHPGESVKEGAEPEQPDEPAETVTARKPFRTISPAT